MGATHKYFNPRHLRISEIQDNNGSVEITLNVKMHRKWNEQLVVLGTTFPFVLICVGNIFSTLKSNKRRIILLHQSYKCRFPCLPPIMYFKSEFLVQMWALKGTINNK